jgi:hypothetical protein
MNNKMEQLLYDLCVDWGFCLPPSAQEAIVEKIDWNADEFACKVLEAEGMNPEYEIRWRKLIGQKFKERLA